MKRDTLYELVILSLLIFNQIIMNFVVYFTFSFAYEVSVNIVNASLVLQYFLQCCRIYHSNIIRKKMFFLKANLNFLPNLVMGALVLYIYERASTFGHQAPLWILYGSIRFVFQILIYTFVGTK